MKGKTIMTKKIFTLLTALVLSIGMGWAWTNVSIYKNNLDYCKMIRTNNSGTAWNISIYDKSGNVKFHARNLKLNSKTIINGEYFIPKGSDNKLSNSDTYAYTSSNEMYSNPKGSITFLFTGKYQGSTNYPIYRIIIQVVNNNEQYNMTFDEELNNPVKNIDSNILNFIIFLLIFNKCLFLIYIN